VSKPEEGSARPARPRKWIKALAVVVGCIIIFGGAYSVVAYRFWANKPQLTRDLLAELNAPFEQIPVEERAWPKLRSALVQLRPGIDQWESSKRTAKDWQALEAFVAENQQAISRLREAAKLPRLGYIYAVGYHREDWPLILETGTKTEDLAADELPPAPVANGMLLEVPLVPQQYLELAVLLLWADSPNECLSEADAEKIVTNVATIADFVRLMQDPPLQASLMACRKVLESYFSYLDRVLAGETSAFTDAQLKQLDEILREIAEQRFPLSFFDERAMFVDLEQRCFTDDGQGDGYLYPDLSVETGGVSEIDFLSRAILPLAPDKWKAKSVSRKQFREKADELFTLAESELAKPLWEASAEPPHTVELNRLAEDERWFLMALMFPDFDGLFVNSHVTAMRAETLRTAVALRRYELRNSKWPDSLDELVPEFLSVIPLDRFDGQPLRYKLQDGSPLLYSVFADKTDNGGKPNVETDPNADFIDSINPELTGKGDLVLWPKLRRSEDAATEARDSTSDDVPSLDPAGSNES